MVNHYYDTLLEADSYKRNMRCCLSVPFYWCNFTIFDLKFYYSEVKKYYAQTLVCCYYEKT